MKQIHSSSRLNSIDLLRGIVLVLMVLDHTRDFFHASPQDPSASSDPYVFFARWITHFCAPVFMLLTGIGAYLYGSKVQSNSKLSCFLATRGLWLIFAELVIVRFAWMFNFDFSYFLIQVIFAIGGSMIALAGMVFVPRWAIGLMSFVMIFGHNMLDNVSAESFSPYEYLWNFVHAPSIVNFGQNIKVHVLYPLVPWIGVVALGYFIGPLYQASQKIRVKILVSTGIIVTAGFFILRLTNLYGNPMIWEPKDSLISTAISFLNVEKYPPSLLFLMMTLGPSMIFLAYAEHAKGWAVNFFVTFGRVPFFFYITHLLAVHALAVVYAKYTGIGLDWLFGPITANKPDAYGIDVLYLFPISCLVIATLYPLCKWFGNLKRNRNDWWLSYL